MPSLRQLFLSHVAQTSNLPMMLEVDHAKGIYIYDTAGKKYFDMNSGISVSSLGHCHPKVSAAIKGQVDKYAHTMVYGEHIQNPQVAYASLLSSHLHPSLDSLYYVMSGTEATEGAMKLAKRYTGRTEIIACANAYHGSTQGAESLRSDEDYKRAFYPLLPDVNHIEFNNKADLANITKRTACVILEPVQAEAGVLVPEDDYLIAVRKRCDETGTLMILDEIQTGFGRTGYLFAYQKYNVKPDILLVGKAMGGGMPIAGFISSQAIMSSFVSKPVLGHITTFGGHPVCCAAAEATLSTLLDDEIVSSVLEKEKLIKSLLVHPIIKEVRSSGLMMAVELTRRKYLKHVVGKCYEIGLIVDWFLFNNRSFRLAPPLIISSDEIKEACAIILEAMDFAQGQYK